MENNDKVMSEKTNEEKLDMLTELIIIADENLSNQEKVDELLGELKK